MVDWKTDLDSFVQDTEAFAQRAGVELTPPNARPLSNWAKAEREEIKCRVANFKAHQERFMREREDHVAAELARMRERL
jgi:hypothetical protein